MPVGKPLQLRLFLEGEEVPVIAAQVSINMDAPASASIQVVPLDEALDLKPRTMVHLFFLDDYRPRHEANRAEDRSEEDRLNIPFLDNYKLLFSGEVVGFQFVKSPNSRAVVLQCLDFSIYWDTAHATAIEYGPNGNAFTHSGSLNASNTGLFDDIVNTTSDQLVRWINQRPLSEGLKNISGLAGGVIHMLEQIGGIPKHSRGVNDFFTIAELRCKVLAQIVAEENDPTAGNLLKVKVFDEWLRNGLQNAGQQVSFRDMLKVLFGFIHYEVVPNPAPKFDESVNPGTKDNVVTQKLKDHPQGIKAISDLEGIIIGLTARISNRDPEDLSRAAINFKNALKTVDANLAALQVSKKSLSNSIGKCRKEITKAINVLDTATATSPGPTFIQRTIDSVDNALTALKGSTDFGSSSYKTTTGSSQRLRTQIIRPDCYFSAPPRCNVIFPEQYTQLSYDRLFLSEVTRSLVLTYNTLIGKEALLANRFLAPNVGTDTELLAVKPGKEGYRSLMKHELHTGIIPRSEWLPNIASFSAAKTDSNKDDMRSQQASWARKIALFHFFKYRFGPRTASVGGRFNPYLVAGFPALVITRPFIISDNEKLDRATDAGVIEFLLSQSTRQSNAPVAPSQLLGLISAMSHSIDQNGGSTSVSMTHVRKHLGADDEFIGVMLKSKGSVKKRIRVRLTADAVARSSNQRLKTVLLQVTPQAVAVSNAKVGKKSLVSRSAQGKKTTTDKVTGERVTTSTSSSYQVIKEASAQAQSLIPPLTVLGKIDKIDREVLIPSPPGKLSTNSKGVFGKIIGIEVKDATVVPLTSVVTFTTVTPISTPGEDPQTLNDQNKQFSGGAATTKKSTSKTVKGQVYQEVILYEEIDVPTETQIPIEEILRPKWFSPSYSNQQIGEKIYMPFFGVPSIIDEAAFDGLGESRASSTPANVIDGDPISAETNLKALISELSAKENAVARVSIERSVNFISYAYGLAKTKGLDVDDFIRQYANRPIATLPQMLGDPDLDFTLDAKGKATVSKVTSPDGSTRTPRIGFHSLAVHPRLVDAANLAGLLDDPDLQIQRINGAGKPGAIPPEYDVRKEKKDRVRKYIAALGLGPGFRG